MSEHKTKNWHKIKEESEKAAAFEDMSDEAEQREGGALDHPSYIALEEKLTLAEQQAHENWEKSVRAMAELENVRNRAARDVEKALRYGPEKLVIDLPPIIDSLEQALQLVDKDADSAMHEGLELTMKLFLDTLKKHGVEQINPEGEAFNPQEHEAMTIQEVPGVKPNSVIQVFQKGYKLHDRVIRPARVVVGKPKIS